MRTGLVTGPEVARAAAILGVAPSASPEVVRSAWRAAVRREHPDAGGDPDRFAVVTAAYELLQEAQAQDRAQDWVWAVPASSAVPAPAQAPVVTRPGPGPAAVLIATGVAEAGVLVGGAVVVGVAPVATVMVAITGAVLVGRYVYLALGRPSRR